MLQLTREESVFVLRMQAGENRFNADFCGALERALDEVEASQGPAALVTVGEGKFYSNGLDLEWMAKAGADESRKCVGHVHRLLARLCTLPVITVAAINGHAFAAGAMWVLAHDFRVMRSDRGYFCLPEVDIQIPFTVPMSTLIQAKLTKLAAHESMTTGKRYTGEEARARSIVHAVADEKDVLRAACELAAANANKPRGVLGQIKKTMYRDVVSATEAERAAEAARFEHASEVELTWHAFELDPSAPRVLDQSLTHDERLAKKYGMPVARAKQLNDQLVQLAAAEGLAFDFANIRTGNTFDAHRLARFAREHGREDAVIERCMRAYFCEGRTVGEQETLISLATDIALDEDLVRGMLEGDRFADDVRRDEAEAGSLGIHGVPCFVFGRRYAVEGAQPTDLLVSALERAWSER